MARKNYEIAFQFGASLSGGALRAITSAGAMVDALGAKVKDLEKTRGQVKSFQSLQQAVKKSAAEYKGMEKGAKKDKLRQKIEAQQKQLVALRDDLKKTGVSLADLAREEDRFAASIDKAKDAQERFNQVMASGSRLKSSAGMFAKDTMKSVGLVVGATTAFVGAGYKFADATAAMGDESSKTAASLGLTSQQFQEFRYAAGLSGVSAQQFDASMKAMHANVAKAAVGQGKAVKALEECGISATKLARTPMDKRMSYLAGAMSKIEDPAKRARLSMALFGNEGPRMEKMLLSGRDGLAAMRKEAVETGYVLSEEAVKSAEDYADAKQKMTHSFIGVRNTVGAELLPVFTELFGSISESVIGSNKDVKEFAQSMSTGLREVLPHVREVLAGVTSVGRQTYILTGRIIDAVGGFENFGKIIGAIVFARPVLGLARMGTNAARFGVDIFKAGKGLHTFIKAGGGMGSLVAGFGGKGVAAFGMVTKAVSALNVAIMANPIGAAVAAVAIGAGILYAYWDDIKAGALWAWNAIGEGADWLWNLLPEGAQEAVLLVTEPFRSLGNFFSDIFDGVLDIFKGGWALMNGDTEKAWEYFQKPAKAVFAWFEKKLEWFNTGISKISEGWNKVKSFFGGGDKGGADIPAFARGGVVSGPTLALVGEGGAPESIIPHEKSPRSLALWQQAGEALGVFKRGGATQPAGLPRLIPGSTGQSSGMGGAGTVHLTYSPTFVIEGNADKRVMEQASELSVSRLRDMLMELMHEQNRLALA